MSLFLFLTVIQALVAAGLVAVVLMQQSEGGGLGMGGGGSPGGLMSARGAANFMTRATAILASLFVGLSIVLAIVAVGTSGGPSIEDSLDRSVIPAEGETSAADLLGTATGDDASAEAAEPASDDPLAGATD